MRFSVTVSAARRVASSRIGRRMPRLPSRVISSAACAMSSISSFSTVWASQPRYARYSSPSGTATSARPHGLASHAIAARSPTETLPAHDSAFTRHGPSRTSLKRSPSHERDDERHGAGVDQRAERQPQCGHQPGDGIGRVAVVDEAVHQLRRQHGDRDLPGVERDLVRRGAAVVLPGDGAGDGSERRDAARREHERCDPDALLQREVLQLAGVRERQYQLRAEADRAGDQQEGERVVLVHRDRPRDGDGERSGAQHDDASRSGSGPGPAAGSRRGRSLPSERSPVACAPVPRGPGLRVPSGRHPVGGAPVPRLPGHARRGSACAARPRSRSAR